MSIQGQLATNVNDIIKDLSKPWIKAMAIFGTKKDESELDLSSVKSTTEIAKNNIKKNRSIIIALWEAFTVDRDEISKTLLAKKESSFSYLAGFHMGNIARVLSTLKRVNERHPQFADLSKGKHIHIFDIACGTGACSLALTKVFKKNFTRSISYYLTDGSSSLLDIAKSQLSEISPSSKIMSQKKLIEDINLRNFEPQNGLNIYSLGYVWNELKKNKKAKQKLEKLFSIISNSENPSIILISEPANEQQARGAMELRNDICELGLDVAYPCSHNAFCHLLEKGKDWCYSEFSWERPYLQKFVDTILDLKRTNIGSSSYVFTNKAFGLESYKASQKVIVGKPNVSKYKQDGIQLLICDKDGIDKSPVIKGQHSILKGEQYFPNQKNRF
jgi:hypothetical protein